MSRRLAISALVCVLWSSTTPANATFHLWEIKEVYSNADGSVQFIELFTPSNNQQSTFNTSITTIFNTNTFIFPTNTPFPTANQRLLLATAGFESLPGGVTPDFNIPANFFNPAIDFIDYVGTLAPGKVTLFNTPTDGLNSAFFPGNVAGTNSPTNFAGDVGKLVTLGDLNEDGTVNSFDADLFIQALVDCKAFEAANPTVNAHLVGDVNEDGMFNLGDVDPFSALLGGQASFSAVPEPSAWFLALFALAGVWGRRRGEIG